MRSAIRTLFVSDVHLGTPGCHAEHLLRLLSEVRPQQLILVGDVVDLEAMHRRPWWHPLHTACVQTILRLAREGCEVVYIPGNHDAPFRHQAGQEIHGVRIEQHMDYRAQDGSVYRVSHGDEFDATGLGKNQWLEAIGESLYETMCWLNRWYNRARRSLDLEYSALSVSIKKRVGRAMEFIRAFEDRVIAGTQQLPVDGAICGHIHFANIRLSGGIAYLNTGDWVEHCSTLVEPAAGGFELWQCADRRQLIARLDADWWRVAAPAPLPSAA